MRKNSFFILLVIGTLICLTAVGSAKPYAGREGSKQGGSGTLTGAGASFPFPIYSQWAYDYEDVAGVQVNYQSVGSGAGIAAIEAKTVDYGASDAPLTTSELDQYGLIQFPMVMGGVVLVINVPGISSGQLKLTSDVVADIYLGNITNWNDNRIKTLNPGVTLPDKAILTVHRTDGSGTTWIFTNYLDKVSTAWHDQVGAGKAVEWPLMGVGGRGNAGVANYVSQVDGAIGYVEYAYATQNHLTYTQLKNKAGNFVQPTLETFASAASNADWASAPRYALALVDQPGAQSWPITGASFIIIYKNQTNQSKARTMLEFFDWCFRNGQDSARSLDYVPMPDEVVTMVENLWTQSVVCNGTKVW